MQVYSLIAISIEQTIRDMQAAQKHAPVATLSTTATPRPGPGTVYPPRGDRFGADLRRFDLALGIDLAVALSLSVILGLRIAAGDRPEGKEMAVWAAILALVWGVTAGGIALHRAGRTQAAIGLLAVLAGPVAVLGLALAPVALFSLTSAVSSPSAFREWLGPDLRERLTHWAIMLALIAALLPASLLTRPLGRHMLGYGVVLGALAMISVLLIGFAGGFLFRGVA